MKAINKYTLDEWLFDYFENNLTLEEQIALHDFLKANPESMEEYEMWKETFISAPLPQSLPLESLLISESPVRGKVFSSLIFPAVLIGLLFIGGLKSPVQESVQPSFKENKIQKVVKITSGNISDENIPAKKKTALFLKEALRMNKKVTMAEKKSEGSKIEKFNEAENIEAIEITSAIEEESLPDSLIPDNVIQKETALIAEENSMTAELKPSQKAKAKATKKKFSTKEERRAMRFARKMKQRTLDRREQEQFLKGKKPYVVPVNLKNF